MKIEKGIFTISIDFEFGWGIVDRPISAAEEKLFSEEIEITRRLLKIFNKYNISATWAIVGHLLEEDCNYSGSLAHSDCPRPVIKGETKDWFHSHSREKIPAWFDTDGLIKKIIELNPAQEIATHSYAHIIYGNQNVNPLAVDWDLKKAREIHEKNYLPFQSLVFPRNQIAFLDKVKSAGLEIYRGDINKWYKILPGPLKRMGHLIDYFLPTVYTFLPEFNKGLLNIPGSLLLLGRNGIRKLIPTRVMEKKIVRGIKKAAKKKKVFHFWFHPSNFSYDQETQFKILETVLREANKLQDRGDLEILTLSDIKKKHETRNT